MSSYRIIHNNFNWGIRLYIFEYLTLRDLYSFACTNKAGGVAYLRERSYRRRSKSNITTQSTHFLSKYHRKETVLLVSYPRSGNSLCRQGLEDTLGLVTGSDSHPCRTLSASLLSCGYRGEGVVDDSVWVVKSHYPERMGYLKFPAHRVILLVRNPFDSIESYFHMGFTNTHNKRLSKRARDNLQDIWQQFVDAEAKVWTNFHEYWLKQTAVPILIVRYEDLVENKQGMLSSITEFMTQNSQPIGFPSLYKPRQQNNGSSVGYKPSREITTQWGKSLSNMSNDQIENILAIPETASLLSLFGYTVDTHSRRILVCNKIDVSLNHVEAERSSVIVNDKFTIRCDDDIFGRKVTELRQSLTENDSRPFETDEIFLD